jgi:hypothetical protein
MALSEPLAAEHSTRFFRFEGLSLSVSGVLFLAKALFDLRIGEPPAGGAEFLAWRSAERFSLAMTNELLFFAVVLLLPGVIGLYSSLAGFDPRKAAWGCGLIAVVIQLVVSVYYGGQHAVGLLFCAATITIAVAMRRTPMAGRSSRWGWPPGSPTSPVPTRG